MASASLPQAVFKEALAPLLRADGYSGSRGRFHRDITDGVQVVSLFSGSHNVSGLYQFTIALALHLPEVDVVIGNTNAVSDPPREHECAYGVRLGTLAFGDDLWWTVEHEGQVAPVSQQVQEAWIQHGKPFMDTATTLAGARDLMALYRGQLPAVAASIVLDDTPRAKQILHAWLPQLAVSNPRYTAKLEEWGAVWGLI